MTTKSKPITPAPAIRYCLIGLLLFAAVPAIADEHEDAIAACARVASTGDRILCLEEALRRLSPTSEPVEEHVPETVAAGSVAAATVAEETPDASAVAPQGEASDNDIGSRQVEARNRTREEELAALESASGLKVSAYEVVPYERLVVRLENGQVWRQIKGDTQRFRVSLERNQTVDISESRFGGGYQLRLNEMRRTIRVERIQ